MKQPLLNNYAIGPPVRFGTALLCGPSSETSTEKTNRLLRRKINQLKIPRPAAPAAATARISTPSARKPNRQLRPGKQKSFDERPKHGPPQPRPTATDSPASRPGPVKPFPASPVPTAMHPNPDSPGTAPRQAQSNSTAGSRPRPARVRYKPAPFPRQAPNPETQPLRRPPAKQPVLSRSAVTFYRGSVFVLPQTPIFRRSLSHQHFCISRPLFQRQRGPAHLNESPAHPSQ